MADVTGPLPRRGRLLEGPPNEQLSSSSSALRFSARPTTGIFLASISGVDILSKVSRMRRAVELIESVGGADSGLAVEPVNARKEL